MEYICPHSQAIIFNWRMDYGTFYYNIKRRDITKLDTFLYLGIIYFAEQIDIDLSNGNN